MASKRISPIVWVLAGVLCVVYLLSQFLELTSEVRSFREKLYLTRVIAVGRARSDIVHWMGEPNYTIKNARMADGRVVDMMVYRSNTDKMNKRDDIWVAVGENNRVEAVYYPDFPQDRAIVESQISTNEFGIEW